MKIIVTGAGGFVGSYMVRELLSRGHEVVSLGIGGEEKLQKLGIKTHETDILDMNATREVIFGEMPDAVVHLAAISNVPVSWEKPAFTVSINVNGTINVLSALAEANPAARFLNVGSSDEYGLTAKKGVPLTEEMDCAPQNPYSISKLAAEQLALQLGKKYGVTVISTRSFNHFGPGQAKGFATADFASQIAKIERGEKEPVMRIGDLSAARDFTFVADVVRAYAALIESRAPSGVYNICSGRARKIGEVLDTLLSLSQTKIETEKNPALFRSSEVPFFVGSHEKLTRETGWEPEYDFEKGLLEVLDYWRGREK